MTIGGEGIKIWSGGIFSGGAGANFSAGEGDSYMYYTYTYVKGLCQQAFIYNEEAPCTSHISCAQVVILLLQDLSTLCVTDMV